MLTVGLSPITNDAPPSTDKREREATRLKIPPPAMVMKASVVTLELEYDAAPPVTEKSQAVMLDVSDVPILHCPLPIDVRLVVSTVMDPESVFVVIGAWSFC